MYTLGARGQGVDLGRMCNQPVGLVNDADLSICLQQTWLCKDTHASPDCQLTVQSRIPCMLCVPAGDAQGVPDAVYRHCQPQADQWPGSQQQVPQGGSNHQAGKWLNLSDICLSTAYNNSSCAEV